MFFRTNSTSHLLQTIDAQLEATLTTRGRLLSRMIRHSRCLVCFSRFIITVKLGAVAAAAEFVHRVISFNMPFLQAHYNRRQNARRCTEYILNVQRTSTNQMLKHYFTSLN